MDFNLSFIMRIRRSNIYLGLYVLFLSLWNVLETNIIIQFNQRQMISNDVLFTMYATDDFTFSYEQNNK